MESPPTNRWAKCCASCLIVLFIVSIVFTVAFLGVDSWVYSEDEEFGFTGGIVKLKTNDAGFAEYAEYEFYSEISNKLCKAATEADDSDEYRMLCRLFQILNISGSILIPMVLCLIALDIVALVYAGILMRSPPRCPWCFLPIGGTIANILTYGIYCTAASVTFDEDCETLVENDRIGSLCAGPSARALLHNLSFKNFFFLLVCYTMLIPDRPGINEPSPPVVPAHNPDQELNNVPEVQSTEHDSISRSGTGTSARDPSLARKG